MEWKIKGDHVIVALSGGELSLSFPETGGIRLQYGIEESEPNWCPILIHEPAAQPVEVHSQAGGLCLASQDFIALVAEDGALSVLKEGRLLWYTPPKPLVTKNSTARLMFNIQGTEQIYGLGQDPMAHLNQNGCERRMWNQWGGHARSGNCGIGFFTSDAGYGMLLNSPAPARFCFGESEPAVLDPLGEAMVPSPLEPAAGFSKDTAMIEVQGGLDLFVLFGNRSELMTGYYQLTGFPKLLPKWAFGFLQCKNRYMNRDELLATARRFRESNIPCDGLIIDWLWFHEFGDLGWREDDWPCAAQMLQQLGSEGFHVISAQHPFISEKSKYYGFYMEKGYLNRVPPTKRVTYDHTNPAASAHWWGKTAKLHEQGIGGYWIDMGELEEHFEGTESFRGTRSKTHNAYSLMWAKGLHEGQKADFGTRAFILSRSGCAGIQKYGTALWSGDISSTWQVLRDQIIMAQGAAMSGLPWWCTDIGGFLSGDEFTPELYIRWMEWGVFLSVFRTHGTRPGNEPWSFGTEAQPVIESLIRLRYRLLPYIYSLALDCSLNGRPVVRPMSWEYPDDPEAVRCEEQFFFGPSLLAAPVTHKGVRSQRVYLPKGRWRHWWSGLSYGQGWHSVPAPLGQIPLFVREGSIIPVFSFIGRNVEDCKGLTLLTVGEEGDFDYYNDSGEGFGYEAGEYTHIRFKHRKGAVSARTVRGMLPPYDVRPFEAEACDQLFAADCTWRNESSEITLTFLKEGTYAIRLEPESGWKVTSSTAGGAKAGYIFEQAYFDSWEGPVEGKPGDCVHWQLVHTAATMRLGVQEARLHITSSEGKEETVRVQWDGPYLSSPWLLGCLPPKGTDPLETVYRPEEEPQAPFYDLDGKVYHWQRDASFARNSFGYVDFRRLGTLREGEAMLGVAYARQSLYSEKAYEAPFILRYDSPIAIFMNGEKIYKGISRNACEVRLSLKLKAGCNTLLIKQAADIARPYSGGEFGFSLKLSGEFEIYRMK